MGPLLAAPMVGITHAAFRSLVEEYSPADLYYSEMISAGRYLNGSPWEESYADGAPDGERMVFQLTGSDPDILIAAANKLVRRPGYGVDINMGCSAPNIRAKEQGVVWMERPEAAARLIERLRRTLPAERRVSAKLRLGEREDPEKLLRFCRGLQEAGADFLVLHPRTRKQTLSRPARWDLFADLAAQVSIPIYGNGDIDTATALQKRINSGAAGFMVGRALVSRPWVLAELRGESLRIDRLAAGMRFLELCKLHLPIDFLPSRIKRFFFYYCDSLRFGHRLKFDIQNNPDPAAVSPVLEAYFERNPGERTIYTGSARRISVYNAGGG